MGTVLSTQVAGAHEAWAGLPPVYSAPEADSFYGILDTPLTLSESFQSRLTNAAAELDTFARAVRTELSALASLERAAVTFHDRVVDGVEVSAQSQSSEPYPVLGMVTVEWYEDTPTFSENTDLWESYFAIHQRLLDADNACADAILSLRAVDERLPGQVGGAEPEPGTAQPQELPWGQVIRGGDPNLRIAQIAAETFGGLFGYNALTGQFSPELAGESWMSVLQGYLDIAQILANPVESVVAVTPIVMAWGSGQTPRYDPNQPVHRAIAEATSPWGIDIFQENIFQPWEDDFEAAMFTTMFGLMTVAYAPLTGGAQSALFGSAVRAAIPNGGLRIGNATIDLVDGGLNVTTAAGAYRIPPGAFSALGGMDWANALEWLDYRFGDGAKPDILDWNTGHPQATTDVTPGSVATPEVPGTQPHTFSPRPGAEVLLPEGEVAPSLVSGRNAPEPYTEADVQIAWDDAYVNQYGVPVDPRTGAPLVGGPPGTEPRRSWVMYWDEANDQWVAGNRGDGWGASNPRHTPMAPATGTQAYVSGDPAHPGAVPTGQAPAATTTLGSGESGIIHEIRVGEGLDYQRQISGFDLAENGTVPVYQVVDAGSGNSAVFEGYTVRGNPPTDVYLEAHSGYGALAFEPESPLAQEIARRMLDRAASQLDVLPEGAQLEWHVSDAAAASAVRAILTSHDMAQITVVFTPAL